MARYKRPELNYNASDVWAAACAAQRINRSYIKILDQDAPEDMQTNRSIVIGLLADPTMISVDDFVQGEKVRAYYKGFTFKILQGIKMSDFDNTAMVIANRDEITELYDLAVITSLPSCYLRSKVRDDGERRLRDADGGFIGQPGDKVTESLEVIRCVFSNNFNVHFVTGLTPNNEAVFFSYRDKIAIGTNILVQGTVKAHRDDSTQLTRTKVF